jgi:UDP-N-acetylmuramoylalanine--D-glutamate ligase
MGGPYSADRLSECRVVVDRLDRDGAALSSLLASRGARVVVADPAPDAPAPAGVELVPDRLAATRRADLLMADCWTGETAPHVIEARERGMPVGGIADVVLHEARAPVIGVTGTAGKTMTARLIAHLLRASGLRIEIPPIGRAENAWPSADSLAALAEGDVPDAIVLELTSTHLAYVSASPHVAVVTALWPDHVELHGTEGRYIAAKQRILGRQRQGDIAILPARELRIAAKPGVTTIRFSGDEPLDHGVGVADGVVVDRLGDGAEVLGDLERLPIPPHLHGNVAAALAAVRGALGVPATVAEVAGFEAPRWRGEAIGACDGRIVLHNGMAATPAKASAALRLLPDRSAVLIVGGLGETDRGPVHASPSESRMLERACAEMARTGRRVLVVGPAASRIAPMLTAAGAEPEVGPDLHWAVGAAVAELEGADAIAWVPAFPVDLEDRVRFADLVRSAAASVGRSWAESAGQATAAN